MERSLSLFISISCAIALGACSRADTRPAAPDARIELAAEVDALPPAPPLGSVAPEATGNVDGAAPGNSGPMPVLNQLLTTQALLVSLLLAPLAKEPHELTPAGTEPAPPAAKSGNTTAPEPAPSVRKRMLDLGALRASG